MFTQSEDKYKEEVKAQMEQQEAIHIIDGKDSDKPDIDSDLSVCAEIDTDTE